MDDPRDEKSVSDVVESLILDLLEWVANGERSYDEVMDAWRTSCPRFPVCEDANDRGLIAKHYLRLLSGSLHLASRFSSSARHLVKAEPLWTARLNEGLHAMVRSTSRPAAGGPRRGNDTEARFVS